MGLFHCPVGAPFYDDEACIDCRMCLARTSEEKVEASKKIRAYINTQSDKKTSTGKIVVAGKGGAGKSTVVALLSFVLVKRGYQVTVLDADESNPGLNRMLGFTIEPEPLSRFIGGQQSNSDRLDREKIDLEDIPPDYFLSKNGLRFMMIGKIVDPFQGCACSLADIARDFVAGFTLREKNFLLVDTEAGTESFGRGVERSADTILVIVEPSYNSVALAEKVVFMAKGMGIRNVWAILNKVPDEDLDRRMKEQLKTKNIKTLGTIFRDPQIAEGSFEGKPLGVSRASQDIDKIVDLLLA